MNQDVIKQLSIMACKVRMGAIEGVSSAKSGHPGGSLSIADILSYLYFYEMNIDPDHPKMEDRDRFVLSKGHCAPALYATLANRGYFPVTELSGLRKMGALLQGHPDMKNIPGVDMSTGSLGQGVSAACGIALSAKLRNKDYNTYAILGDGEIEEGQVWEAAMFAAHKKLDNLCVFIDNNGLQIDGKITDVCSPEPIPEKFKAFGFDVLIINAHDFNEIDKAVQHFKANRGTGKPTAVIARSVKGKGVSFMENEAAWHGVAPNGEQTAQAMDELRKQLAELEG